MPDAPPKTARKIMAGTTPDNYRRFRAIFDCTFQFMALLTVSGNILEINRAALQFVGAKEEDVIGQKFWLSPWWSHSLEMMDMLRKAVKDAANGELIRFEASHRSASGDLHYFDFSLKPVFEIDAVVFLMAEGRDISERKQAELSLAYAEAKYRSIYENAIEGIFQLTPDGHFLSTNLSHVKMLGYGSADELIKNVTDIKKQLFVNPQDHRELGKLLEKNNICEKFETRLYRKDGSIIWVSLNARTAKNNEGKIIYYEGTVVDITGRKISESSLIESEERYRIAIEKSNDGVAVTRGGRHLYVNEKFLEIFGYEDVRDIIGKSISVIVHPDDQRRIMQLTGNKRQKHGISPSRYEFKGIRKDGSTLYIEVSASKITYFGEFALLAYLRDITERKLAEEILRKHEEELKFKSASLEEANIALKALARHIEENRQELEENIILNVKTLVFPYIQKMQNMDLNIMQTMFMEIIKNNLNNIISPFLKNISQFGLTPAEMHIAGLIKDGRKTKDIAESLHISCRAVEVHRYNIRKKLKINNIGRNLCAFLLSMDH